MAARICYLGDDHLGGAASYLAGIMGHYEISFDHFPSDKRLATVEPAFTARQYALYVISDYPAANFQPDEMAHLVECVRDGSGLAMFGGWESYFGRLGEYHASPLAAVLPVVIGSEDDRWNCAQPCLIRKVAEHPVLSGLPWDTPPSIGGFNRIAAKPSSEALLTAVEFTVRRSGETFQFSQVRESPLLIVGRYGQGRTAALATDVAPHWVGGLVDWGDRRVVQSVGQGMIEVGNWYAQFFRNLLIWTGSGG